MSTTMRVVIPVAVVVVIAVAVVAVMLASPKAKQIEVVVPPGTNVNDFSVTPYAETLKAYVDDDGMVDYAGLKEDPEKLNQFLKMLDVLDPKIYDGWSNEQKVAFWINAYNAITLKAIIANYPIEASVLKSLVYPKNSIRQIPGVWEELQFRVLAKPITLDQIEHATLRKDFDKPRIHVALVCTPMGCPPLRNEPYVGEELGAQLTDQAERFLSNDEKFRIDRENNTVFLSSILKWFGEDFVKTYATEGNFTGHEDTERAVLNFISEHVGEKDAEYLRTATYDIEYLNYDWSLNEQAPAASN